MTLLRRLRCWLRGWHPYFGLPDDPTWVCSDCGHEVAW